MKVNIEDIILLNGAGCLGFKRLERLMSAFGSSAGILKAGKGDLAEIEGIDENIARKITSLDGRWLSKELRAMETAGVRAVSVFDGDYPENLKTIYSPPILLYVMGGIKKEDADAVAIVGTRQPSRYGVSICEKIAHQLASMGITVVSGLARGIDTAAHKGAISAGRTIAVLGSGLADIYPFENMKLVKEICGDGAVVSEFPMHTPPYRANFPMRNRVISGLSLGILVVEASKRSGSLITADFALAENRELFAVPGEAGSPRSEGSNNLIKEGAKLIGCVEDIMVEIENNLRYKHSGKAARPQKAAYDGVLTDEEKKVKYFLSDEPLYIDDLAKKSDISLSRINSVLLSLEFKKVVKELPGKNYILR